MSKSELARVIIKDSIEHFQASIPYRAGAALAYRGLFALAPTLFVSMLVVGSVFGRQVARQQVELTLEKLLGPKIVQFIDVFKQAQLYLCCF